MNIRKESKNGEQEMLLLPHQLSFTVTWFDTSASKERNFILNIFVSTFNDENTTAANPTTQVEMYEEYVKSVCEDDVQTYSSSSRYKLFLSRISVDHIDLNTLEIGQYVEILSRKLKITGCVNSVTCDWLSNNKSRPTHNSTFAMIKPDGISNIGNILKFIESSGFEITQCTLGVMTPSLAEMFYDEERGRESFSQLIDYITEGPVLAMELTKSKSTSCKAEQRRLEKSSDAINAFRKLIGPTDSSLCADKLTTIRGQFGTDKIRNVVHGSASYDYFTRESALMFESKRFTPIFDVTNISQTSCLIIKSHAVKSHDVGCIIQDIEKTNLQVRAMKSFQLNASEAEHFLEVYQSVVPNYNGIVRELCSGTFIVLQIGGSELSSNSLFNHVRELCGPHDPHLARTLSLESLRAKYGLDDTRNGVHCTDLIGDVERELNFFFG